MLFVIAGPSYVGKKTTIAHFMKLYSFSSVIPYTTKPDTHRVGETEGIQYHYVEEDFKNDIVNEDFIYDAPFRDENYKEETLYAYKKSDLENAIESYSNFIIHASVGNVEKMHAVFSQYHRKGDGQTKNWMQQVYFIFLDFDSTLTEDFFRKRQPDNGAGLQNAGGGGSGADSGGAPQGGDARNENAVGSFDFNRRFTHAQKEEQFYNEHPEIFDKKITSDKQYILCEKLEDYILPKLRVMPTSPDKIPGPLSNLDVLYMCEKRKKDPLVVYVDGAKADTSQVEKMLCGCGMHLSLSKHIRKIRCGAVGKFIDMANEPAEIEMMLDKLYPGETISKGYTLRPNEMVLCSSNESLKLPHDVYAVVASKFSYTQLGLSIELSTSVIQSGHNGNIHFQIKNNTDNFICIYPDIEVAQLLFFRTIQPSNKTYFEDSNHAYDRAGYAPISKFRENNNVLDNAKKPKKSLVKEILVVLKEKSITKLAGLFFIIIVCILYADKFIELANKCITPVQANLKPTLLVVLFAVVCCLLNFFILILGSIVLNLLRTICKFMHEKLREKD